MSEDKKKLNLFFDKKTKDGKRGEYKAFQRSLGSDIEAMKQRYASDELYEMLPRMMKKIMQMKFHNAGRSANLVIGDHYRGVEHGPVYYHKFSKWYAKCRKDEIMAVQNHIQKMDIEWLSTDIMLEGKIGEDKTFGFYDDVATLKNSIQVFTEKVKRSCARKDIWVSYEWHPYMVGEKWLARCIWIFPSGIQDRKFVRSKIEKFGEKQNLKCRNFSYSTSNKLYEKFLTFLDPLLSLGWEDEVVCRAQAVMWIQGISYWYHDKYISDLIPKWDKKMKKNMNKEEREYSYSHLKEDELELESESEYETLSRLSLRLVGHDENDYFTDTRKMGYKETSYWNKRYDYEWMKDRVKEKLGLNRE